MADSELQTEDDKKKAKKAKKEARKVKAEAKARKAAGLPEPEPASTIAPADAQKTTEKPVAATTAAEPQGNGAVSKRALTASVEEAGESDDE